MPGGNREVGAPKQKIRRARTHQNSLKQGIFFGWQRVAGGHFCINTKIEVLFHPVNSIFTTQNLVATNEEVDLRSRDRSRGR